MWYWFFESRNNPDASPLILWLTGGPGCSGTLALLKENGPYIVRSNLTLEINPYSWNEVANVIWIDQPVGTGFSYTNRPDDYVSNEGEVAIELYQFIQIFLDNHPKFRNNPFYLTGESYGGHYVPHFAAYIIEQNSRQDPSSPQINLRGISIGNGWVSPIIQYKYYPYFLYQLDLIDKSNLEYVNKFYPVCYDQLKSGNWKSSFVICNSMFTLPILIASRNANYTLNPYDVRLECTDDNNLCYDFSKEVEFMSQPDVLRALNVSNDITSWSMCSGSVYGDMTSDFEQAFSDDILRALDSNITVLLYSGIYDYVCNHLGNYAWLAQMNWQYTPQWRSAKVLPWSVDGKEVGQSQSYANLWYYKIYNAGHMVPMDQPQTSLELIKRFISN